MNNLIEIKDSQIHGKGGFALTDIKADTKIIEYIGEKISKEEGERRANQIYEDSKTDSNKGAVYIFELNDEYDLDGNTSNNPAKYINHSCTPNCEVEIINDRIFIIAKEDIKKGEEIFFNYSYSFDEDSFKHPCKCGTNNCLGYIVDPEDKYKLIGALKKKSNRGYK